MFRLVHVNLVVRCVLTHHTTMSLSLRLHSRRRYGCVNVSRYPLEGQERTASRGSIPIGDCLLHRSRYRFGHRCRFSCYCRRTIPRRNSWRLSSWLSRRSSGWFGRCSIYASTRLLPILLPVRIPDDGVVPIDGSKLLCRPVSNDVRILLILSSRTQLVTGVSATACT